MVRQRSVLLLVGVCAFSACAGDGCPGGTPAEGEFPEERKLPRPLRFRLTSQGAAFIGDKTMEILQGILGGEGGAIVLDLAKFDMDDLDVAEMGVGTISLRDLKIAINVRREDVTLELLAQPGRFHIRVVDARISIQQGILAFAEEDGRIDLACRLADGLDVEDPAKSRVGSVTLELVIQPFVNEFGRLDALVDVPELTIIDWGVRFPTDCELLECTDGCAECTLSCPVLSGSAAVANALLEEAKEQLSEMIQAQIHESIDTTLAKFGAQPLDFEINIAELLGERLPSAKTAKPIRAMLAPSIGGINVNQDPGGLGLDVLFEAGVDAEPHRCVSPLVSDPVHEIGPPPGRETSPTPVHFVLAFAGGALDAAVWSAFKSGLLCVSLSSAEIAQLSDRSLALTAGGVESLLPGISSLAGPDAPLLVTLEPGFGVEDFPLVRVRAKEDGSAQIVVSFTKVGLSLHAEIDGRFARVIGLQATAEITAGLVALPDATLEATLDNVEVKDLHVTYEEVLPGRDLSELAGFVSSAVAGGLLSGISFPVAAPGAVAELLGTGIELEVDSIRADGDRGDWIAARLALVQTQQTVLGARTRVEDAPASTPLGVAPSLSVPAADADGRDLEYQVKVDYLPWTSFTRGGLPDLSGPHWKIHGDHAVRVRARYVGVPRSLDMAGWSAQVRVDAPPAIPRVAGSEPVARSVDDRMDAADPGQQLEQGCTQPDALAPLVAPMLLAPLLRRGGGSMVWASLLASCEDGDPKSGPCLTTADCPARQACSRGACVPAAACGAPSDCCPGQVCLSGLCQDPAACDSEHCAGAAQACDGDWCVRLACVDDGGCPAGLRCVGGRCVQGVPCDGRCVAGEVCHAVTAECRPTPSACGGTTCPAGGLLHVVDPTGAMLGGGCGWDEATCECVESPPLQAGDIGRWGSAGWLDGKAVAAAYDATYADLVWLEWDGPGPPSLIESVSGVPLDQPRVAAEGGYRGGIAVAGPRTGRHTALVVSGGTPVVAHRDDTNRSLAVAVRGGTGWSVHLVDSDGDAALGVAATLMAGAKPGVAYVVMTGAGQFELRLVLANSAVPVAASDWGRPVILPIEGAALTSLPAVDMATTGDKTVVAWASGGRVGVATSTGGAAFRADTIVETGAGPDVAVAVSGSGAVAVVYGDPAGGWVFSSVDGQVQTLDDGARSGAIRRLGAWPTAGWKSGSEELLVAYQDPFDGDLWLKRGTGATPPQTLATEGAVGFHNDLLLDGPGGAAFVYTARLGFDGSGRSVAGPLLIRLP